MLNELAERETAYGLLQRGKALMKRRHNAQAAVLLERARRLEPGKGSIVEPLARAYYNSGQHQLAADCVRGAARDRVRRRRTRTSAWAKRCKQIGQRDSARTHLRLAVALAPQSALYRQALERLGR